MCVRHCGEPGSHPSAKPGQFVVMEHANPASVKNLQVQYKRSSMKQSRQAGLPCGITARLMAPWAIFSIPSMFMTRKEKIACALWMMD